MHESMNKPVSKHQRVEKGPSVISMSRRCVSVLAFLMIVPLSAQAQQYKIDKPIFGFYLGESKESLLGRAERQGVEFRKEKTKEMLFPDDGYVLDGSLDNSQSCKRAAICFFSGYVVQIDIELTECTFSQWQQMADDITRSWGVVPDTQRLPKVHSSTFTCRDALIVMASPNESTSPTMVLYVHRQLWSAASKAKLNTLSAQQF
jgi:hypothetical protein